MKNKNNDSNPHHLKRYGAALALSAVIATTGFTSIIAHADDVNKDTDKNKDKVEDKNTAKENVVVPRVNADDLKVNTSGAVAVIDSTQLKPDDSINIDSDINKVPYENKIKENTYMVLKVPYRFSSKSGKIYKVENPRIELSCDAGYMGADKAQTAKYKANLESNVEFNKVTPVGDIDSTSTGLREIKVRFNKVDYNVLYKFNAYIVYTINGVEHKEKVDLPSIVGNQDYRIKVATSITADNKDKTLKLSSKFASVNRRDYDSETNTIETYNENEHLYYLDKAVDVMKNRDINYELNVIQNENGILSSKSIENINPKGVTKFKGKLGDNGVVDVSNAGEGPVALRVAFRGTSEDIAPVYSLVFSGSIAEYKDENAEGVYVLKQDSYVTQDSIDTFGYYGITGKFDYSIDGLDTKVLDVYSFNLLTNADYFMFDKKEDGPQNRNLTYYHLTDEALKALRSCDKELTQTILKSLVNGETTYGQVVTLDMAKQAKEGKIKLPTVQLAMAKADNGVNAGEYEYSYVPVNGEQAISQVFTYAVGKNEATNVVAPSKVKSFFNERDILNLSKDNKLESFILMPNKLTENGDTYLAGDKFTTRCGNVSADLDSHGCKISTRIDPHCAGDDIVSPDQVAKVSVNYETDANLEEKSEDYQIKITDGNFTLLGIYNDMTDKYLDKSQYTVEGDTIKIHLNESDLYHSNSSRLTLELSNVSANKGKNALTVSAGPIDSNKCTVTLSANGKEYNLPKTVAGSSCKIYTKNVVNNACDNTLVDTKDGVATIVQALNNNAVRTTSYNIAGEFPNSDSNSLSANLGTKGNNNSGKLISIRNKYGDLYLLDKAHLNDKFNRDLLSDTNTSLDINTSELTSERGWVKYTEGMNLDKFGAYFVHVENAKNNVGQFLKFQYKIDSTNPSDKLVCAFKYYDIDNKLNSYSQIIKMNSEDCKNEYYTWTSKVLVNGKEATSDFLNSDVDLNGVNHKISELNTSGSILDTMKETPDALANALDVINGDFNKLGYKVLKCTINGKEFNPKTLKDRGILFNKEKSDIKFYLGKIVDTKVIVKDYNGKVLGETDLHGACGEDLGLTKEKYPDIVSNIDKVTSNNTYSITVNGNTAKELPKTFGEENQVIVVQDIANKSTITLNILDNKDNVIATYVDKGTEGDKYKPSGLTDEEIRYLRGYTEYQRINGEYVSSSDLPEKFKKDNMVVDICLDVPACRLELVDSKGNIKYDQLICGPAGNKVNLYEYDVSTSKVGYITYDGKKVDKDNLKFENGKHTIILHEASRELHIHYINAATGKELTNELDNAELNFALPYDCFGKASSVNGYIKDNKVVDLGDMPNYKGDISEMNENLKNVEFSNLGNFQYSKFKLGDAQETDSARVYDLNFYFIPKVVVNIKTVDDETGEGIEAEYHNYGLLNGTKTMKAGETLTVEAPSDCLSYSTNNNELEIDYYNPDKYFDYNCVPEVSKNYRLDNGHDFTSEYKDGKYIINVVYKAHKKEMSTYNIRVVDKKGNLIENITSQGAVGDNIDDIDKLMRDYEIISVTENGKQIGNKIPAPPGIPPHYSYEYEKGTHNVVATVKKLGKVKVHLKTVDAITGEEITGLKYKQAYYQHDFEHGGQKRIEEDIPNEQELDGGMLDENGKMPGPFDEDYHQLIKDVVMPDVDGYVKMGDNKCTFSYDEETGDKFVTLTQYVAKPVKIVITTMVKGSFDPVKATYTIKPEYAKDFQQIGETGVDEDGNTVIYVNPNYFKWNGRDMVGIKGKDYNKDFQLQDIFMNNLVTNTEDGYRLLSSKNFQGYDEDSKSEFDNVMFTIAKGLPCKYDATYVDTKGNELAPSISRDNANAGDFLSISNYKLDRDYELVKILEDGKEIKELPRQVEKGTHSYKLVYSKVMPTQFRFRVYDKDTHKFLGTIACKVKLADVGPYGDKLDVKEYTYPDMIINGRPGRFQNLIPIYMVTDDMMRYYDIDYAKSLNPQERYKYTGTLENYKECLNKILAPIPNGDYQIVGTPEYSVGEENGLRVVNVNFLAQTPHSSVIVETVDENGNKINGAEYELKSKEGTYKEVKDDKSIDCTGFDIEEVSSTKLPNGYVAIGKPEITSEKDGINTNIKVVQHVKAVQTEVRIQTLDVSNGNKNIKDISYEIKDANGKVLKTVKTGDNGATERFKVVSIGDITEGEIPKLYAKAKDQEVKKTVDKDGNILITVTNYVKERHPIMIKTVDENGLPVGGVTYTWSYTNMSGENKSTVSEDGLTYENPDDNFGTLNITGLPMNYVQNGAIVEEKETIDGVPYTVYIGRVKQAKTIVNVKVVDEDGKLVSGADVNVTDINGQTLDNFKSTDKVHHWEKVGTYGVRVSCDNIPEGYLQGTEPTVTTNTKDGITTVDATIHVVNLHSKTIVSAQDIATGKCIDGAIFEVLDKDGKVIGEFTTKANANGEYYSKINNIGSVRLKSLPKGWIVNQALKMQESKLENGTMVTEGNMWVERLANYRVEVLDEVTGKAIDGVKIDFLDENGKVLNEATSGQNPIEYTNLKNLVNDVKFVNTPVDYIYKGYPIMSYEDDAQGFRTNVYKFYFKQTKTNVIVKSVDENGKDVAGQAYIVDGKDGKQLVQLVSGNEDVSWNTVGTPVTKVEVGALPEGYVANGETTTKTVTDENGVTTITVITPIKRTSTNVEISAVDQNGNKVEGVKANIVDKDNKTLQTVTTNTNNVIAHFVGTPVSNLDVINLPKNYIAGGDIKKVEETKNGVTTIKYVIPVIKTSTVVKTAIIDSETGKEINGGQFLVDTNVITSGSDWNVEGTPDVKVELKEVPAGYIQNGELKVVKETKNGVTTIKVVAPVRQLKHSTVNVSVIAETGKVLSNESHEGIENSNVNINKPIINSDYELVNITNNDKVVTALPSKYEMENQNVIYHVKKVNSVITVTIKQNGKNVIAPISNKIKIGTKLDNALIPQDILDKYTIDSVIVNGVNTGNEVKGVAIKDPNEVIVNVTRKEYKTVVNFTAVDENGKEVSDVVCGFKDSKDKDLGELTSAKSTATDLGTMDIKLATVTKLPNGYVLNGDMIKNRHVENGVVYLDYQAQVRKLKDGIINVRVIDENGKEVTKSETYKGQGNSKFDAKAPIIDTKYELVNITDNNKIVETMPTQFTEDTQDVVFHVKHVKTPVKVVVKKGNEIIKNYKVLEYNVGDILDNKLIPTKDLNDYDIIDITTNGVNTGKEVKGSAVKDNNTIVINVNRKDYKLVVNVKAVDENGNEVNGIEYNVKAKDGSSLGDLITGKNNILESAKLDIDTVNVIKLPKDYIMNGTSKVTKTHEDGVTTISVVTPVKMKKTVINFNAVDSKTGKDISGVKYVISDKLDNKIEDITTQDVDKTLELKGDNVGKIALESLPNRYHKEGDTVITRTEKDGVITINVTTKLSKVQEVVSVVVKDTDGDIVVPAKTIITTEDNVKVEVPVIPEGYVLVSVSDNGQPFTGDLHKLDGTIPHHIVFVVKKSTSTLKVVIKNGDKIIKSYDEVKVKIGGNLTDDLLPVKDMEGYDLDHIEVNGINTGKHITGTVMPTPNTMTIFVTEPQKVVDEGTGTDETTGVDESTGTDTDTKDEETQVTPNPGVDEGTEVKPDPGKDEGTQVTPEPGKDEGTQTPSTDVKDEGTQTTTDTKDEGTQTDTDVTKDDSSQTDTDVTKDEGTETPVVDNKDEGTETPVVDNKDEGSETVPDTKDENIQTPSDNKDKVETSKDDTKDDGYDSIELGTKSHSKDKHNNEAVSETIIKDSVNTNQSSDDLMNDIINDMKNSYSDDNTTMTKELPKTGDVAHNTALPIAGLSLAGIVLGKLFRRK